MSIYVPATWFTQQSGLTTTLNRFDSLEDAESYLAEIRAYPNLRLSDLVVNPEDCHPTLTEDLTIVKGLKSVLFYWTGEGWTMSRKEALIYRARFIAEATLKKLKTT